MKKILFLIVLVFTFSCGINKNINSDPYVGNYNMTIFDVDQIGDIFLELSISKNNNGYESSFNFPEGEESIEVISSRVNNGFFEIEEWVDNTRIKIRLPSTSEREDDSKISSNLSISAHEVNNNEWVRNFGYCFIKSVELQIGGTKSHKH